MWINILKVIMIANLILFCELICVAYILLLWYPWICLKKLILLSCEWRVHLNKILIYLRLILQRICKRLLRLTKTIITNILILMQICKINWLCKSLNLILLNSSYFLKKLVFFLVLNPISLSYKFIVYIR